MSEIKLAIEIFKKRNHQLELHPTGANPSCVKRQSNEIKRNTLAIQALTEKLEREQGCNYCKTKCIQSMIGYKYAKFCPMCGRRLQNE